MDLAHDSLYAIDIDRISPVVDPYADIGPKGYGTDLILARIIKIRERILSDRQLAKDLKKNDRYRFVTQDIQPSHNIFNALQPDTISLLYPSP